MTQSSKTYRVERATLSSSEYSAGLIPAWNVVCKDDNGSHVVKTVDTRTAAQDAARRLRGGS